MIQKMKNVAALFPAVSVPANNFVKIVAPISPIVTAK
jgi:hypothetical protein